MNETETLYYLNCCCRRSAMAVETWVVVEQITEHLGVTCDTGL